MLPHGTHKEHRSVITLTKAELGSGRTTDIKRKREPEVLFTSCKLAERGYNSLLLPHKQPAPHRQRPYQVGQVENVSAVDFAISRLIVALLWASFTHCDCVICFL